MSVADPPPGIPDEVRCKNRLQEYTQRASMLLPVYQTFNEGAQHAPHFRSRVWVDGTCFTSPNTFPNRKMAEQEAAKHALISIRERVKNEGFSRIREDTIFCKSIIHEYASKMNLQTPSYVTHESKAMLPMFVSSVIVGGVAYEGDAGRNKKDAEQFAARAAILSILGSESGSTMSEIVRSKFKYYDALKKVPAKPGVEGGIIPAGVNPLEDGSLPKEVVPTGGYVTVSFALPNFLPSESNGVIPSGGYFASSFAEAPRASLVAEAPQASLVAEAPQASLVAEAPQASLVAEASRPSLVTCPNKVAISESLLQQPPNACPSQGQQPSLVTHQPLHELEEKLLVAPPNICVPSAPENSLMSSTSGKKRKRKNKKANKKAEHQSPLTIPPISQSQVPAC